MFAQDSSDEVAIREIIRKFSNMWTEENGIEIAEEIFSEKLTVINTKGAKNKEEYKNMINVLFKNNRPLSHEHEITKIIIQDNIAFEYGPNKYEIEEWECKTGKIDECFSKRKW